jgi:hypothetical protein
MAQRGSAALVLDGRPDSDARTAFKEAGARHVLARPGEPQHGGIRPEEPRGILLRVEQRLTQLDEAGNQHEREANRSPGASTEEQGKPRSLPSDGLCRLIHAALFARDVARRARISSQDPP